LTSAAERQVEPQRRRGPYAKTAARRLQIIGAAAEAFGESGYESASIRDIADRLGLSHAAVTFHFNTKRELLAAVLERQQQELSPVLDRATENPLEFLAFVVRLFQQREATPDRAELFLMLAAEAWSPDHPAREYMLGHYARLRSVIGGVFRALADAGLLRAGVDADEAARFGVALTDGLQLQWLYAPAEVSVSDDLASFFLQALNAKGRRRLRRLLLA
jgi:AcrR family transcriptional regulator